MGASGRYRKRPIVIDAWHWANSTDKDMPRWLADAIELGAQDASREGAAVYQPDHQEGARLAIVTKEGSMYAVPGDWIIRGTHDELYPCKPDIFATVYEPAEG